jgi:AcrR family transcriptional regulator
VTDQRRERGLRTKTALITSALALFSENGFQSTTIDAIVDNAHVSQRTFFHHFPSKEHVLFDGYAERLDHATSQFRATPRRESLWCALYSASMSVINAIEDTPDTFLERARLYEDVNTLRELMLRINEDWIESLAIEVGRRLHLDPTEQVGPRLAAMLANGANRTALDIWTRSQGTANLHQLAIEALELVRPAIMNVEHTAIMVKEDAAYAC